MKFIPITQDNTDSESTEAPKQRRQRKNKTQLNTLIGAFKSEPVWEHKLVQKLADLTGLTTNQVYKWGWDYKKKLRLAGQQVENRSLE